MDKPGLRVIVCRDVHDSPRPPRPDAQRASCALCHRGVWVSKSSVEKYPEAQLVCNRCGFDLADIVPPGLMYGEPTPAMARERSDALAEFERRRRDPRWRAEPFMKGVEGFVDSAGNVHLGRQRPLCDFCCAPDPVWDYPCGWVDIPGGGLIDASNDEWAACQECHALIEANEWEKLAYRCMKMQAEQFGTRGVRRDIPADELLGLIRETQQRFARARKGPAVPYRP